MRTTIIYRSMRITILYRSMRNTILSSFLLGECSGQGVGKEATPPSQQDRTRGDHSQPSSTSSLSSPTIIIIRITIIIAPTIILMAREEEKGGVEDNHPIIIIIITRPKPANGRQGLAGLWGQDTDEVSTFLVFLTNQKQ